MTDSEIVKALEHCIGEGECMSCPENPHKWDYGHCIIDLMQNAFSLITRQQAEIERLKTACENTQTATKYWHERSKKFESMVSQNEGVLPEYEQLIKSEARREFAERLIAKAEKAYYRDTYMCVDVYTIDKLLEEMEREP